MRLNILKGRKKSRPYARGRAGSNEPFRRAEAAPRGAVVPALGRRVLRGRRDNRRAHHRARRRGCARDGSGARHRSAHGDEPAACAVAPADGPRQDGCRQARSWSRARSRRTCSAPTRSTELVAALLAQRQAPLPAQLKKGLARAFESSTPISWRSTTGRDRFAFATCCSSSTPKPKAENKRRRWKKLAEKELDARPTPGRSRSRVVPISAILSSGCCARKARLSGIAAKPAQHGGGRRRARGW